MFDYLYFENVVFLINYFDINLFLFVDILQIFKFKAIKVFYEKLNILEWEKYQEVMNEKFR